MDHNLKYLKYKSKYLNLKHKKQHGGMTVIDREDDSFLSEYSSVKNSGQKNCGIFLNNNKDIKKIIKCENPDTTFFNLIENIKKKYPNYTILPEIYNIYKYNDKHYIEMEKFNGDVTQLLFEILPKEILKTRDLSEDNKKLFYDIFFSMIPKTVSLESFIQRIYVEPLNNYLYQNQDELSEIIKIDKCNNKLELLKDTEKENLKIQYDSKKINSIIYYSKFSEINNKYNNIKMNKYRGKDNKLYNINPYNNKFKDYIDNLKIIESININYEEYESFIKAFETELFKILETVRQQITRINILLSIIGLTYSDPKIDNYGFILLDTNKTHLGINWTNNNFYGKFIFITLLDWESGLSKFNESDSKNIIENFNYFNMTKYGQYYLVNLISPLIYGNIEFLDKNKYDFFSKKYDMIPDIKYRKDCQNLIDVNNFIQSHNETIDLIEYNNDTKKFDIELISFQSFYF